MSGVPTGPSGNDGLAKFGEAEIGFGLKEFVIYGTDGRTVIARLYDLRYFATVCCDSCYTAFNAAGKSVRQIAEWIKHHYKRFEKGGEDGLGDHPRSILPD